MAQIDEMRVVITADATPLQNELKKAEKTAEQSANNIKDSFKGTAEGSFDGFDKETQKALKQVSQTIKSSTSSLKNAGLNMGAVLGSALGAGLSKTNFKPIISFLGKNLSVAMDRTMARIKKDMDDAFASGTKNGKEQGNKLKEAYDGLAKSIKQVKISNMESQGQNIADSVKNIDFSMVFKGMIISAKTAVKVALNILKGLPAGIKALGIAALITVMSVKVAKSLANVAKQCVSIVAKLSLIGPAFKLLGKAGMWAGSQMKKALTGWIGTVANDFTSSISKMITSSEGVKSGLSDLKGAFLTAFQPILSVAIPAITALISALTALFGWLGRVGAMLSGTTYGALQNNAKASYQLADGMDAAGGAAENANNTMGIDELNVISDSGSGGSNGSDSIIPDFSNLGTDGFNSFTDSFNSMLDSIIAGLPNLQAGLVAAAESINGFFSNLYAGLTDGSVVEKVKEVAVGIATALNGFLTTVDWTQVGATIGAGLNRAFDFVLSFLNTFDFGAWAKSFADSINGFIHEVDWTTVGQTISAGLQGALTFCIEFIRGIDWQGVAQGIVDMIKGIDWWGLIQSVFTLVFEVVKAIWTVIATLISQLILQPIGQLLENIKTAINTALEFIKKIIYTVVVAIYDIIAAIFVAIFTIIGITLLEIYTFIDETLATIKNIIETVWNAVKLFVETVWTAIKTFIVNAWTAISSTITTILTNIKTFITNTFNAIKTTISNIWTSIKTTVETTVATLKTNVVNAFTALKTLVISIFNGIKDGIKTPINGIIGFINKMISSLVSGINKMIDVLNSLSFEIPDWVPEYGGCSFGLSISHLTAPEIPTLARGGLLNQGSLFIAGEAGPEMVGQFGNQTGVLNSDQIVDAVSSGVYSAVLSAMKQTSGSAVNVYLDGKQIESSVRKTAQSRGANIATGGILNYALA